MPKTSQRPLHEAHSTTAAPRRDARSKLSKEDRANAMLARRDRWARDLGFDGDSYASVEDLFEGRRTTSDYE